MQSVEFRVNVKSVKPASRRARRERLVVKS